MGLETGTYISDLNASNPIGATDQVAQADDHLRLIKSTILATFPNVTGAMTLTHTQLNNAALKNETNEFTVAQRLLATEPRLQLSESDQAADEKVVELHLSGGVFAMRTRDDTYANGNAFIEAHRTGTVVDDLRLIATTISARSGGKVRAYDAGNTDYVELSDDGTNSIIATSANNLRMSPVTGIVEQFTSGLDANLRLFDDAASGYLQLSYNGTHGQIRLGSLDGDIQLFSNSVIDEIAMVTQGRSDDTTTSAKFLKRNGVFWDVGFNALPLFNDDVSDTLDPQHSGALNIKETTTAVTLTLEANTGLTFPVNHVTHVANVGSANNYVINEGTGTTLYLVEPGTGLVDTAGGCTLGPGGFATIWRRSSTDYWIFGSEITV